MRLPMGIASPRAAEAGRRATFKLISDTIAEGGQFDSPLHKLAVAAITSAENEPAFWSAAKALPPAEQTDLLRRINAKRPMLRKIAAEYLRLGIV